MKLISFSAILISLNALNIGFTEHLFLALILTSFLTLVNVFYGGSVKNIMSFAIRKAQLKWEKMIQKIIIIGLEFKKVSFKKKKLTLHHAKILKQNQKNKREFWKYMKQLDKILKISKVLLINNKKQQIKKFIKNNNNRLNEAKSGIYKGV